MHLIPRLSPAALLLSLGVATSLKNVATAQDRLPKNIVPSHYFLDLIADPDKTSFSGCLEITIIATDADDGVIRLHASPKDLSLETILLDYEILCNVTDSNANNDIVTLACPRDCLNGEHKLVIEFSGRYSIGNMYGFYKSTYEEDGTPNVLVSTQFEASSARRAFPCFDEPMFKATYDIYITHPIAYNALANTPVKNVYFLRNGQIQTQFETTPIMSSYLVAFVISKFVENGACYQSDYVFKVYSRPEAKVFTNVASAYGPTLINLLSCFMGINYADLGNHQEYLVAIPDFAAGAMENWGLITFREIDLLDEGKNTTASDVQRIITNVAHELSHMWIGDYVTLDWWSDIWLNEGFATYFEYHIPAQLENINLETDKQFVIDVVQGVFQNDAIPSANPLSGSNSRFDSISYDKGSSVIRMIKYILGEDAFRAGLHNYLITFRYNNANPNQLLTAIQAVTGSINITNVMSNWIFKPGFPLVTVTLNSAGNSVHLKQERFLGVVNNTAEATQWYIPISYTTSEEKNFEVEIKTWVEPDSTVDISIKKDSWIILNIQQSGYYRVNYDDELWDRIIKALNDKTVRTQINVLNRAQLVDDVFNIARVGKTDYENAFRLLEFLGTETEYYPWVSALNAVSYLLDRLADAETDSLLQERTLRLITNAFPDLFNLGTSHVDILKTVRIWDWACRLGQKDCINYATTTFESFKITHSIPDYNKREIVFCNALRNSGNVNADYEFLFDVFKRSKSSVEQITIIYSLGCITDPDILLKYLLVTLEPDSPVRLQDSLGVLISVFASQTGVDVALKFLEENMPKIIDMYKGMDDFSILIVELAGKLKTDEQIDRLTRIIQGNQNIEEVRAVGQNAIDIMSSNKEWSETYGSAIKGVLEKLIKITPTFQNLH